MFFNRRRKYNGKVAALLPAFGFNLEEAGVMKTTNVLDIAWNQKYSEYEGALYVAYLVFSGMLKARDSRADEVLGKIEYIQKDWVSRGLIRKELASQFSSKAKEWTQGEEQTESQGFEFLPNMPDIMQSEPVSAHIAGQHLMLLVEDVPSIAERMSGSEMPLRFPYVLAVVNSSNNQPTMFVTLEEGLTSSVFLCVFDASGTHSNLGSGEPYMERYAFEKAAIEIVCQSLKLDVSSVVKASS
tara:strand:+ start:1067 stop:1792 length:726 start_codon:yes stop_codon:yes gene_type:complete